MGEHRRHRTSGSICAVHGHQRLLLAWTPLKLVEVTSIGRMPERPTLGGGGVIEDRDQVDQLLSETCTRPYAPAQHFPFRTVRARG